MGTWTRQAGLLRLVKRLPGRPPARNGAHVSRMVYGLDGLGFQGSRTKGLKGFGFRALGISVCGLGTLRFGVQVCRWFCL